MFSPTQLFADSVPSVTHAVSKTRTAPSYQEKIDKLQEELDQAKTNQLQSNIDAFNRSSDAANRLINWVGIIATIYGIIIAIASLFIGFISIRNQKRSEEALKTLEGAKSYVNQKISEVDDIAKRKIEEVNKKLDDFIQLALEQLTQDTQEATKKVKEIEEKGITTEASKKIELIERKIKIFDDIGMPNDPKVLYSKAMVYKEKKELHEALELLHKATHYDPKYANAYFQIGHIQGLLNEVDKSIAAYDKAIEYDPKDAASWNNKGVAFDKRGKKQEALDCYNKAIEINPTNTLYHNNKIIFLEKSEKNVDELIKSYDALIKIEPDHMDYYLKAGRLLNNFGRSQDSAKYYKGYLDNYSKKITLPEADESDHLCYYEALIINKDYTEADTFRTKMDSIIKSDNRQVTYALLKSYALFLQGQEEQALQQMKKVLELIGKSSYTKLTWNFEDINPYLLTKLDENKYQLCLTMQKAAEKEVPIDSVKLTST